MILYSYSIRFLPQENVHGLVLKGEDAKSLLSRAASRYVRNRFPPFVCNCDIFWSLCWLTDSILIYGYFSPFFVQPVFRDDGYFMMVSQFQAPGHFLMAYLEDYQMDPAGAQPLLSFSVFDDYAEDMDLTLVRADILNRGIHDDEGYKIVQNMLDGYVRDDEYMAVYGFNKKPDSFDLDDFIARQNEKWKTDDAATTEEVDDGTAEEKKEEK